MRCVSMRNDITRDNYGGKCIAKEKAEKDGRRGDLVFVWEKSSVPGNCRVPKCLYSVHVEIRPRADEYFYHRGTMRSETLRSEFCAKHNVSVQSAQILAELRNAYFFHVS